MQCDEEHQASSSESSDAEGQALEGGSVNRLGQPIAPVAHEQQQQSAEPLRAQRKHRTTVEDRARHRRDKARRKREAYVAEDGTSVFEDVRPEAQGHTSAASVAVARTPSGPSAHVHASVLAPAAKIVMHRDRVRGLHQQRPLEPQGDADEGGEDEDEEDEEDEGQSQEGQAASLGAEEMREKAGKAKETAELMQALREDKEALEDIRPTARALAGEIAAIVQTSSSVDDALMDSLLTALGALNAQLS
eukprot:m51a1_g4298 hypothetical protein (248) ;mRNA; f:344-1181